MIVIYYHKLLVNDVFMYYKILLSRLYSVCISNNIQIIVLAVVMFMVAFSFLMKQSEVKILMNVLCILICIMYLIYLAWTLPLSRFGVPRVGKFQCYQLKYIFFSQKVPELEKSYPLSILAQFGNFRIYLSFKFYVKSIFGEWKSIEIAIFAI